MARASHSDFIELMALGHQFTIGTLYNYVGGVIVPNMRLWDPDDVSQLVEVENEIEKMAQVYKMATTNQSDDDDYDNYEFSLSSMGMDGHSALSFIAGLMRPSSGSAWQYVADRLTGTAGPTRDEVAIHYRCANKKVSLDPKIELEIVCKLDKLKQSQATHVIVSVTYGLEAFCHFSHKNQTANDNTSLEKLLDHSQRFADCLSNDAERLKHFKSDPQLDLECIVYKDSRNARVQRHDLSSLSVNKQYEACKNLLDIPANNGIPFKVRLYPLDKLVGKKVSICKMPTRRKMSMNLTSSYLKMWKLWQRSYLKTNSVINEFERLSDGPTCLTANYQKMKDVNESVQKFHLDLTDALAQWISAYRRGDLDEDAMSEWLESIENESPFNMEKVMEWLDHQGKQIEVLKKLTKFPGVNLVCETEEIEERIENDDQYSFVLVLHLPSLKDQSGDLVKDMKQYIKDFDPFQPSNWLHKKYRPQRSKSNVSLCRKIVSAAQEFSNWVNEHNNDSITVDYIIYYNSTQLDSDSPLITLYQTGTAIMVYDNFTIPKAPGEVTVVKNRRGVIQLKWEPEEETDYEYLLQYRLSMECDENDWQSVEHQTNSITIKYLQSDECYIFRVAVLTLAGRGPFGPESEEITIDSVCPPPTLPQCQLVTDSSIDITWDHNQDIHQNENPLQINSYSVECCVDGIYDESNLVQRLTKDKQITIEPLDLDTVYCIQIRAVCTDSTGSIFYSPASPILKIKTLKEPERAAQTVRRSSERCKSGILGINTFQLKLRKHRSANTSDIVRYVFGAPSYLSLFGKRRQRTILVLGATGSGKSTLINAMANYILGVEWNDDFRFKLIDESTNNKSQAHSQTDKVTTYDLYEMKGSRLNYSLTLVDTPGFGDSRGMEKDKKIMAQIQDYFKSRHGIQQLEAVCFVVQSSEARLTPTQKYIFDSILSIFGRDIQDNIRLMVTFADNAVPPVLAAIQEANIPSPIDPRTNLPLHHKFNNSIFFTSNQCDSEINEINETYFEIAVEGFVQFFDDLSRMEAKSLILTREVLDERKRLEALAEGLQIKTQMKLTRVDELEQIKKKLAENRNQAEANNNFEFEVEFLVPKSTDISGTGQFTTNCQNCKMTCHFPCRQGHDQDKNKCSVMNPKGNCTICKCHWSKHFNQRYRYEMVMKKEKRSSDAIRKQYQAAQTQMLTNEELLKRIENDIKEQEKQLMELMEATYPHIQRLDEIALRPHTSSTLEYIDLMIDTEKKENKPGSQQRIVTLNKLRHMSELMAQCIGQNSRHPKS